jgi:hypothetical protein
MKKWLLSLLAATFLLTGCFETTEEITVNEDGSGSYVNTSDLSAVLTLAKNMGGGGDMEKLTSQALDTSFSLAAQADSSTDMNAEDKALLKRGKMQVKLNGKEEKFYSSISFNFNDPKEISRFNKLSAKAVGSSLKGMMADNPAGQQMNDMPEASSFNDYFDLEFEKDNIKRSINKEKYAHAGDDEYLKGLKEASGMGIPVTATYIINLPRPAIKVEGKNVKLSEDKKKVTVKVDIDDFFDNPEKLEFKIKY